MNYAFNRMELIRITSETCSACIIMREVMRRVMPEFPDFEIVDLDRELDEDEVKAIKDPCHVPFLKCGDKELEGSCTMDALREFLQSITAETLIK